MSNDPSTREEAQKIQTKLVISSLSDAQLAHRTFLEALKWNRRTAVFQGRTYWAYSLRGAVQDFYGHYKTHQLEKMRLRQDVYETVKKVNKINQWLKDKEENPNIPEYSSLDGWQQMQSWKEKEEVFNKYRQKLPTLGNIPPHLLTEDEEQVGFQDLITQHHRGIELRKKTKESALQVKRLFKEKFEAGLINQQYSKDYARKLTSSNAQYFDDVVDYVLLTKDNNSPQQTMARVWNILATDSNVGISQLSRTVSDSDKFDFINKSSKIVETLPNFQDIYDKTLGAHELQAYIATNLIENRFSEDQAAKLSNTILNALEARNISNNAPFKNIEEVRSFLIDTLGKNKSPIGAIRTIINSKEILAFSYDYNIRHLIIDLPNKISHQTALSNAPLKLTPPPPMTTAIIRDVISAPKLINNHNEALILQLADQAPTDNLVEKALKQAFANPHITGQNINQPNILKLLLNDEEFQSSQPLVRLLKKPNANSSTITTLGKFTSKFRIMAQSLLSGLKSLLSTNSGRGIFALLRQMGGNLGSLGGKAFSALKNMLGQFGKKLFSDALGQMGKGLTSGALEALAAKLGSVALAAFTSTMFWVVVGILLILVVAIVYFIASPLSTLNQALSEYVPVGAGGGGSGDGTPWNGELITFDLKDGVCWPTTGCMGGYMPEHHPSISDAGSAIDVGNIIGTPVISPFEGDVIKASHGFNDGYGNLVITTVNLPTQNGSRACDIYYAHLEVITLPPQTRRVSPGTLIGLMGNTGNSSGSHLHYEVRCGSVKGDIRSLFPPPDRNIQAGQCIINQCVDDKNQPFTPVIIQP
jgi:hypothetical protein